MGQIAIIFFGNFFTLLLINFFCLIVANLIIEQPLIWNFRKVYFGLNVCLFSTLITLASLIDLSSQAQISFLIYSVILILQFLSGYFLFRLFYPMISFAQNLFIQTITASVLAVFEYLILGISLEWIQDLPRTLILLAGFPITLIQVSLSILFCYMIRKSQIVLAIRGIMDYPRFMLVFTSLFFFGELFVYGNFFFNNTDRQDNSWLLSLTYLIVLIIFSLWAFAVDQKKQWEHTKDMLLQQQNYLRQMEDVQKEIRSVHHDYKNMFAGIYLHASEGNTVEIQKFLTDKFFQIDQRIEEKLKQQNQLLLIENLEIKGLLISKLAQAETKGITVHLEVSNIFPVIPMEYSDLLRIMGIFLDNAIEAVTEIEQSFQKISIMMLQDEGNLIIRIKNPTLQKISLHDLMRPNFSTKGKNRGFGLANVKKIVAKYPHVLNDIDLQNDWFIQTLTIEKE